MRGLIYLSLEQRLLIASVANQSHLVATLGESLAHKSMGMNLFERFEEMCRRRKVSVPEALRPGVVKLLAAELASNALVLELDATDVESLTMYHGGIARELLKDVKG